MRSMTRASRRAFTSDSSRSKTDFIDWKDLKFKAKLLGLGIGAGGVALLFWKFVQVIPAGHVAVVDLFGRVADQELTPGLKFVNPLAKVTHFSTKTQVIELTAQVPSKEGLIVDFEVAVLYHLDPKAATDVYKNIGPNYVEVILAPHLRSAVRHLTSGHDAKGLYTADTREVMAQQLTDELNKVIASRGIVIERTLMKEVRLPLTLQAAIQAKLASEQESQRMEFVLAKEKAEAERKAIEARGISDFQRIVSEGVSPALLQWKGIEATEALARSPNAKIVVIGNSKDGLPVILGGAK